MGFGFAWIVAVIGSAPSPAAADRVDFIKDIQPILQKSCYRCHGPKLQMSGLRLDAKKPALAGGQSGKAIQPGSASESPLYKRIAGIGDQPRMPMEGDPLAAAEIDWCAPGSIRGPSGPMLPAAPTSLKGKRSTGLSSRLSALPLPQVRNSHWPINPIDDFVLARLEKEGLAPSPEADRVTLLRRLSLDLIGLPPTIEEVDAFLADKSPNAYEKQVERLLNSPHYGERWGRHWLDAARYADSDGYEKDKPRQVWFYRDWVINALQSRPALRPVHHRANRRRPAAERRPRTKAWPQASCATR